MKQSCILFTALGVLALSGCTAPEQNASLAYPETKTVDTVDVYFGTEVPDPYRWLENDTAQATADWVAAQNDVTFNYLKQITFRDAVRKRLDELQITSA
jgi:prolyl oligopeptidase